MGESLYRLWLEEEVEDLQTALLRGGIDGLLFEFEMWLGRNGHLKEEEA